MFYSARLIAINRGGRLIPFNLIDFRKLVGHNPHRDVNRCFQNITNLNRAVNTAPKNTAMNAFLISRVFRLHTSRDFNQGELKQLANSCARW